MKIHGRRYEPEYQSWIEMKRRCLDSSRHDYPRYGGAGITVCNAWINSFEAFFSHLGPRPLGKTLDRKDWRKGYEPGNVRWATPKEQSENRKDAIFVNGQRLKQIAKKLRITYGAAYMRLQRGTL